MSRDNIRLTYVDMHTAGEPVRIVTGGYPELKGATILEKRRDARETHDRFRRALMWEPRGHAGMYGVIPVPACHPEAAFGVLFTHVEGYSTMCGHATIAMGRYAVERGLAPAVELMTRFILEARCGLRRLSVEVEDGRVGRVSFENVPACVSDRNGLGRRDGAQRRLGGAKRNRARSPQAGRHLSAHSALICFRFSGKDAG